MGKTVSKKFYAIKNGKKYYSDDLIDYTPQLGDASFWPTKKAATVFLDEEDDEVITVKVTWEEV